MKTNNLKFIINHLGKLKLTLAIVIFITILYAGVNLLSNLIFSFVIDSVIGNEKITNPFILFIINMMGGLDNIKNNLFLICILLIVVYTIVAILMSYRQRTQGVISESLVCNIRNDIYEHLQKLPFKYHVSTKTGELIQKCTSDIDIIRRFFAGQLCEIFYILATAIIALIILFNINVKLAFIASISLPIIFLYSYLFFKKVQKQFLISDEAEAVMSNVIQESLVGVRVVKAFNREKYEIDKFAKVSKDYSDVTYKMILSLGQYWSSSYFICLLGILSVVISAIFMVRNSELTIGNFVLFVTYQTMILYPIRQLGRIMTDFGKLTVSCDRLVEILNEKEEDLISGLKPSLSEDIIFKNVSFKYDEDKEVLKNINLDIKANTTVALLGPTGSGKSSLMYLLSRLYDVSDGSISIGDVNINDINKDYLRDNVGVVLQEPFLYSRSIMDNLKMVKNDASVEDVHRVCKVASVHDVINSFDKGYETLVGEKGVTLSGGQKQRVAIARTLLKNTPILILDDSLSAVDTKTDASIREALLKDKHNRTTIIITSRISSAKDADMIYVLEEGVITQSGTHEQLSHDEGLYKRINDIQSKNEREVI